MRPMRRPLCSGCAPAPALSGPEIGERALGLLDWGARAEMHAAALTRVDIMCCRVARCYDDTSPGCWARADRARHATPRFFLRARPVRFCQQFWQEFSRRIRWSF